MFEELLKERAKADEESLRETVRLVKEAEKIHEEIMESL